MFYVANGHSQQNTAHMYHIRDFIPIGSLVLGVILEMILHAVYPVVVFIPSPINLVGIVIIALGLALMIVSISIMLHHKTDLRPGGSPTTLVTKGTYAYFRNPIYLGNMTILSGVAALLGSLTPFLVIPLFFLIVSIVIVPFEEKRLTATFGGEYEAYRKRVRRWL